MTVREAVEHFTESRHASWLARYRATRQQTELLCRPLEIEDYVIQTMPNVSPPKWHLAHVSWFFETFILQVELPGYQPYHPVYATLFNSYYQTVGAPYPRAERGLLARPTVEEVYRYRAHVDAAMLDLIDRASDEQWLRLAPRLELGLQHEQQHQELLLTDIKHIFAHNPLRPIYRHPSDAVDAGASRPQAWMPFSGGIRRIGHAGVGFHFDNEAPRHEVLLRDFELGNRLVTNGDYLAFLADGGYERVDLWLADGWNTRQREHWQAPLYWEKVGADWWVMTLSGMRPVDPDEPVCHVSFYEADAYARWVGARLPGARLPSEAEWELAVEHAPLQGNFVESGRYHPASAGAGQTQLFGDVWEWTQSAYLPYPGYRPLPGALGEYNGKFMCNQMVLRGGSCATPRAHMRSTYRNFFMPSDRWQFTGIRLAKS